MPTSPDLRELLFREQLLESLLSHVSPGNQARVLAELNIVRAEMAVLAAQELEKLPKAA